MQVAWKELYGMGRTHERKIFILKLDYFQDKQKIIRTEFKLGRKQIYIENNLTVNERDI